MPYEIQTDHNPQHANKIERNYKISNVMTQNDDNNNDQFTMMMLLLLLYLEIIVEHPTLV